LSSAKYLVPYIFINGFVYVFAKDGLNYSSPFVFGAITGLITFLALLVSARGRLVLNRDTLLFGFFFWVSGVTWLFGLDLISPAQSAILSFTMPLFVMPLSILVLSEKASRMEAYGTLTGFAGIVVYNLPLLGGTLTLVGAALTLADAFFWALFSVYMRKLKLQNPTQTITTASLLNVLLYSALSFADFSFRPTASLGIDIFYGGSIGGALSFFLWNTLIRTEKLARLTTLVFLSPMVTLVYGAVTAGALPGLLTLGGVALIFVGIYASTVLSKKAEVAEAVPIPDIPTIEHDS
jgi:drug/metabolite transporter (DMT)-like permease